MVISASVMFRGLTAYVGWESEIVLNILQPNHLWYLLLLKVLKHIQFSENCFCYILKTVWLISTTESFAIRLNLFTSAVVKEKRIVGKVELRRDMGEGCSELLGG